MMGFELNWIGVDMKRAVVVVVVVMMTDQVVIPLSTVEKDRPLLVADMKMDSMPAATLRFDL